MYKKCGTGADATKLAIKVLRGSVNEFTDSYSHLKPKLEELKFQTCSLKVTISKTHSSGIELEDPATSPQEDTGLRLSLNLFHLVILLRKEDILKYLLERYSAIKEWLKPVTVNFPRNYKPDNLMDYDKWICQANCLHLAAKYFPRGLQIILSHFEEIEKDQMAKMVNVTTLGAKTTPLSKLINESHKSECLTPLHVASSSPFALSTR